MSGVLNAGVISLTLMFAAGAGATEAPSVKSPAAKGETIPLYLSSKRALMMLRVGDSAPIPVVFDTGTNGNAVDLKVADRLGLPHNGASPSVDGSTGKPVPGYDTFIKGARLGGVAIDDGRASALAFDNVDEVGIFGPNSFENRLVRMEGPNSRLVILPKSAETIPDAPPTPYLGEGGDALPSAVLDFGTLKVSAILDTGNDGPIILPMKYKDLLALEAAPARIGYAISAAGKQPVYRAHLKGAVHIGSVTLDRPILQFMEGGRPNIGLPVLRSMTVIFDPASKRSWITSSDAVAPKD